MIQLEYYIHNRVNKYQKIEKFGLKTIKLGPVNHWDSKMQ